MEKRELTQQEVADIVQETIQETAEDLQDLGEKINLVAQVALELMAMFRKENVEVKNSEGSRDLTAKRYAAQAYARATGE